eukprot:CAMPEP_0181188958 /NCGR_PEP_ID=MMETSP1096-20121128/11404_1 /TAXON_ID=156174 ORGANISM="Chrysochromulina ericina, Strain CCMP281" /NCGR_SAMPLE_ID=MMETSP1096 /ASSEMBLY_ACC=CAM_ASM_000453 /LENGTH=290 /DNA_ID=CAMNT_0023278075 /DNA_START=396 /DNA_END=1270 /DNA_ORIENTATION=-
MACISGFPACACLCGCAVVQSCWCAVSEALQRGAVAGTVERSVKGVERLVGAEVAALVSQVSSRRVSSVEFIQILLQLWPCAPTWVAAALPKLPIEGRQTIRAESFGRVMSPTTPPAAHLASPHTDTHRPAHSTPRTVAAANCCWAADFLVAEACDGTGRCAGQLSSGCGATELFCDTEQRRLFGQKGIQQRGQLSPLIPTKVLSYLTSGCMQSGCTPDSASVPPSSRSSRESSSAATDRKSSSKKSSSSFATAPVPKPAPSLVPEPAPAPLPAPVPAPVPEPEPKHLPL